ncbi:hypothetical protein [Bradyrhizobium jicamae]|nr:hypothetical protein [Bradyrhizobium jicamae]
MPAVTELVPSLYNVVLPLRTELLSSELITVSSLQITRLPER